MENTDHNHPDVKGWGIDADPANDPTYPMKHHVRGEHEGRVWDRPPLQPVEMEILHSPERPEVTAVFGTAEPPSGLSGMLRRFAFKQNESNYSHWLPLMMADRVNMLEGILDDLKRGHFPNILAERGIKAEWKHNRKKVVQRLILASVLTSLSVAYMKRKGQHAGLH
jgi:hypothetical protein